jgi:hypothetical protein
MPSTIAQAITCMSYILGLTAVAGQRFSEEHYRVSALSLTVTGSVWVYDQSGAGCG